MALRLEPFSDEQVAAWVESWNRSTGADLSLPTCSAIPDLARQPLLLLMLALYDADGASLTGRLLQSELYERLLSRFAAREIRKHEKDLDDRALAESVEFELQRLSVAAFAMFNRGQQWVTHDELNRDLDRAHARDDIGGHRFPAPADRRAERFWAGSSSSTRPRLGATPRRSAPMSSCTPPSANTSSPA